MAQFRRLPLRVVVPAVIGLVAVVAAFAVETAMGSGNGHRYLPVHIVQLAGMVLIFLSAVLAWTIRRDNRRSR
jgi:predicted Co/Zn/Cd cation transporter (cation efflux family)